MCAWLFALLAAAAACADPESDPAPAVTQFELVELFTSAATATKGSRRPSGQRTVGVARDELDVQRLVVLRMQRVGEAANGYTVGRWPR